MLKITTHTIVKNEENWIWFALSAWKDFASEMLVVNDASTDRTKEIIESINDKKIKFQSVNLVSASDHTRCRNKMIEETNTDWFVVLDGDEIWNAKTIEKFLNFLEKQPQEIYGVVMRTRNCVGDIFHYQPESAGKYEFVGKKGHLTIRAFRKLNGYRWVGDYPLEAYSDKNSIPLNSQSRHLVYFDDYYWHMTHLVRSSVVSNRKHLQSVKLELGIKVKSESDFPEVFNRKRPNMVPDPWKKRSPLVSIKSAILTPIKVIKRQLTK